MDSYNLWAKIRTIEKFYLESLCVASLQMSGREAPTGQCQLA
jgi:hypothetical protein